MENLPPETGNQKQNVSVLSKIGIVQRGGGGVVRLIEQMPHVHTIALSIMQSSKLELFC